MKVAVLGAGLAGACIALELAANGVDVDLYDRNPAPMLGASLSNEAKIHLGLFYANDPSRNTARLLLKGAVTFMPLLRRLLGAEIERVPVSPPYYYVLHRDSMLPIEAFEAHLDACHELAAGLSALDNDYFGSPFRERARRLKDVSQFFNPSIAMAAYETPEVAISADALSDLVRRRLDEAANVRSVMNATILRVDPAEQDASVLFEVAGERFTEGYDQVVNALWDGRLAVDATAGVRAGRPWLFRMKYDVHVLQAPANPRVPPTSIALGPFGDLVRYSNGEMYLSWYPAGMLAVSTELTPPRWPAELTGAEAAAVCNQTLAALGEIVPGLQDLALHHGDGVEVNGGVIFAWGATDISDPASDLHTRFDIGPHSYGTYHSLDTGKLTTAPLFANQITERLLLD